MDMNMILVVFSVLLFILGSVVYFKTNKPSIDTLIELVKEPLLMLFLYAEKQGWSEAEKMEYCMKEILKIVPIKIDDATLTLIAQKLYDEYSTFIKNSLA